MSASLAPECSERKEQYDTCFINWYSEKYLRGSTKPSQDCEAMFREYKTCLNKALKEKGIYGMIEEARKTSPNNDGAKA
ncbi:mitochondrial distribution/morphology family 35/apoptosis [Trichophaea hybrida]|nr:mitochondrial distribution/morphology family 35/apoptosis [Trichophaea hybrida]